MTSRSVSLVIPKLAGKGLLVPVISERGVGYRAINQPTRVSAHSAIVKTWMMVRFDWPHDSNLTYRCCYNKPIVWPIMYLSHTTRDETKDNGSDRQDRHQDTRSSKNSLSVDHLRQRFNDRR